MAKRKEVASPTKNLPQTIWYKRPEVIALLLLFLANLAVFWPFYSKHLLPFPGDLLVSFFFPWNSGGFPGFNPWTTHKEVIAADVIRQMYPWKSFAFDLIRHFQFPLWNPYNFSGYPLFANLQSSILFPGNILFLFLPTLWAWIALVISLPVIMSLFMYLFLRSLKLSVFASVLGAIAVTNIGFLMVWHEQLIMTQVVLFLPLMLFIINRYSLTGRIRYLLLLSFTVAGAIFGGYAQTFIYVLIISVGYLIFKRVPLKIFLPFLILGFTLSAIQLLPTIEIYLHSAREGEATRSLFAPFVLSARSLATIFAPDFFGNPATNNFWGRNYGDFQVYFGIVALAFASIVALCCFAKREVKFFLFLGLAGLAFALWPLAYLPHILNIPIIATGVPARSLFIFQFCAVVLSAFGLDYYLTSLKRGRREFIAIFFLTVIYFFLWTVVLILPRPEAGVVKSNLLLPSGTFLLAVGTIIVSRLTNFRKLIPVSAVALILLAIGEYSYLFNKYQPFSEARFAFPPHPVFDFLHQNAGINRFFGFGTAYVDNNFATYYRVYGPEGWDSLYIKRYGQLLTSAKDGQLPKDVKRSDALFPPEDNFYRNRLFDLLGIKYILDKNDNPQSNWEPETSKFPSDRYQLVWQYSKWKAYERKTTLPRLFLAGRYVVENSDQEVIKKLYDPKFDPKDTIILEKDPQFKVEKGGASNLSLSSYTPNQITINLATDRPKLLFLSDSYYPGWNAYVDSKQVPIYRADYQLRAIPIVSGKHTVSFVYEPLSFKIGLSLSLISLLSLLIIFLKAYRGNRDNF